jgi:hypothetical protein
MKTTLPCVDGENLPQYVARTGKLPAMQALAFVGQLLATLDRAHRAGMAYPGFGAHDLVVMLNGRPVLTAWCVAKRGPLLLQPAMDDDLLAAAAIAFELMTGRHAAPGGVASGADWFPPSHAGLPLALDAVFERALSPDAGQRYATAAELWQALWSAMGPPVWERKVKPAIVLDEPKPRRAERQLPTVPVGTPLAAPVQRRGRSRAPLAIAGVAAALVLAAIAGNLVSRAMTAPRPAPATAVAQPVAGVDALLDREVPRPREVPAPREEIVAGSPAVLQPRESVQPSAQARDTAPATTTRTVPASIQTAHPQRAPITSPARAEPRRTEAPRTDTTRTDATRTAVAARTSTRKTQVARMDPDLGCTQSFFLTREWCKISKCETAEYSSHPVCKSMRDEQRRRNLVADQALRTR